MQAQKKARVLIADDEETFLFSTADLLRKEGYLCDCAQNAHTATKMLQKGEYDLVISDIKMPGNSDLNFVEKLSQIVDNVSVILVTGYPSTDTAIKSIQLPVSAYLVKPFDFNQLLMEVDKAVRSARNNRIVNSAQERLRDLQNEIAHIGLAMGQRQDREASVSFKSFLDISFQNIYGSLLDIRKLYENLNVENAAKDVCHLFNCPRNDIMMDAISDVINVLEKTKKSFKSKDLAELRKKLESLNLNSLPLVE